MQHGGRGSQVTSNKRGAWSRKARFLQTSHLQSESRRGALFPGHSGRGGSSEAQALPELTVWICERPRRGHWTVSAWPDPCRHLGISVARVWDDT